MAGEQEPANADGAGTEQVQAGIGLAELDRTACLRLLADSQIGPIVFTEGALPAAQPVTYVLDGEEVLFRTADGSRLAVATRNARRCLSGRPDRQHHPLRVERAS